MINSYSTAKEYNKLLISEIIEEFLKKGIVLDYNEIIKELHKRINKDNLGNGPLTDSSNSVVKEREVSSISKFNIFTLNVLRDLKVLFNSLLEINKRINTFNDSSQYEIDLLLSKLRIVDNYLKKQNRFEKLSVAYSLNETFADFNNINQARTTADIDLSKAICSLEKTPSVQHKFYITDKRLEFNVKTDSYIISSGFLDSTINQNTILDDTNRSCLYVVKTNTQQNPVSLEITIKLQNKQGIKQTINKVDGEVFDSYKSTKTNVKLQYSIDGYIFKDINEMEFVDNFKFVFEELTVNYIKLIFTKTSPDSIDLINSFYLYEFNIKNISCYFVKYYYMSTLISRPLYVKDINNNMNPKIFDAVKLVVDSYLPEKTNINYYISTEKDPYNNMTYTNFIPIVPNKKLNLNNLIRVEENDIRIDIGNVSKNKARLHIDFKPNLIPDTIKIWRNVGVSTTNTVTYNGESSGWRKDNVYYKCIIRIDNPEGQIFNFGDNGAIIDGEYFVGLTHVKQGYHKFKTHEKNWLAINVNDTEKADPLYPYNHKLLIEGHPNIAIYKGVDFYAAYSMIKVSKFDFDYNIKVHDYEKFYVDENNNIYVKFDMNELYNCAKSNAQYDEKALRELFRVEYLYKKSSVDYKNIDKVVFKAVLKTDVDYITPVLHSYELQLTYE